MYADHRFSNKLRTRNQWYSVGGMNKLLIIISMSANNQRDFDDDGGGRVAIKPIGHNSSISQLGLQCINKLSIAGTLCAK